jgi:hypothetical protein
MPELTQPVWDDVKRMPVWVNAMLDAELEAAVDAANTVAACEEMASLIEPLESLLDSLNDGTASQIQQWRAAQLIEAAKTPGRPGRKAKPKMDRDALLAMAAQDARRIMQLWREHYDKRDLPRAVKISCERWLDRQAFPPGDAYDSAIADLAERTLETLRRSKARNFGTR